MSTQLSNLVYDLEHNALLAKQFMYSIVVAVFSPSSSPPSLPC